MADGADHIHVDAGLAPDIVYVLDGLLDNDSMDAGTFALLRTYATNREIDAILEQDANEPWPVALSRRRQNGLKLVDLANRKMPGLPAEVQVHIAALSLNWLRHSIRRYAEVYCAWTYEDETTGGAMKAWRDINRVRGDGSEGRRIGRRLRSPKFLRRVVQSQPETSGMRVLAERIFARVDMVPKGRVSDDGAAAFAEAERLRIEAERHERTMAEIRTWSQRERYDEAVIPPIAIRLKKKAMIEARRKSRTRRKVIKRASQVAESIIGRQAISDLSRGDPVILEGNAVDLMVRSTASLGETNHGTLDISVHKKCGVPLAKLCVYIKDTPALDQVTAFWLMMQSGEEDDIIRSSNLVKVYDAGREHPVIAERERLSAERARIADAANWTPINPRGGRQGRMSNRQTLDHWKGIYAKEMLPVWVERTAIAVCGRRVKDLPAMGVGA